MSAVAELPRPASGTIVLEVRFDRIYGRITCYPNNPAAELIAKLSGHKTLTPEALAIARALGCDIQVSAASRDLLDAFIDHAVL